MKPRCKWRHRDSAAVAVYPREWVERTLNLVRFTNMPRGGHFPSLEEPELFVESLRGFLGDLREK